MGKSSGTTCWVTHLGFPLSGLNFPICWDTLLFLPLLQK